jgi:hypothetical protein
MTDIDSSDKNFRAFIAEYGEEGFLRLFLTNYLFELVTYYLHSQDQGEDDPGYLMHVDHKGDLRSAEEIDKFNQTLRKECADRADRIVEVLKTVGPLKEFVSSSETDERLRSLLNQAFKELVRLR